MKVFLRGGSYTTQSLIASAQRSLNLYAEEIPRPSGEPVDSGTANIQTGFAPRSSYTYYPTPGMDQLGPGFYALTSNITPQSTTGPFEPGPPGVLSCAFQFHWAVNLNNNSGIARPITNTSQTDKFGNLITVLSDNSSTGLNPVFALRPSDGSTVWSLSGHQVALDINAYCLLKFGSVQIPVGFSIYSQTNCAPICQGQYIIIGIQTDVLNFRDFAHWFAIYEATASGPPTLLGAVWYPGIQAPPFTSMKNYGVAGNQTPDDPILFLANFGFGGFQYCVTVLPSVNQIANATYNLGPFLVPQLITTPGLINNQNYYPLSSTNLSLHLYDETGSSGIYGRMIFNGGFWLPGPEGDTNFYCYMNHGYMDQNSGTSGNNCPEVAGVLLPVWPLGVVVKIRLGLVVFTNISGSVATNTYTVDNASWGEIAGLPVVPFRDEYRDLRPGNTNTTLNVYEMKPGIAQPITSGALVGKWLVGMTMSGQAQDGAPTVVAGDLKYQALRAFAYNPGDETFEQIGELVCAVYHYSDVALAGSFGTDDTDNIFFVDGNSDLQMYGFNTAASQSTVAYCTKFGHLTLP
jgi:hypothetical protein